MNCLILGGAGFMGSHIADAMVSRGHGVRIFDLPNISTQNLAQCRDAVDMVSGDFHNASDVSLALEGMDMVIHLVCTTLPGPSNQNPVYDVESNVMGTLRLLESAARNGVKKVVFASSGGTVYGVPRILPVPETHETDPLCSYGITKLTIEKYLALYRHLYDLDYTILRFGNPYGERQRTDGVQGAAAVFLGKTYRKETITIWGDGNVARDYFYISDLVSAVVRAAESPTPSKIYNIASGSACSLNELLSIIREVTGRAPAIRFSPGRKLDVPMNCLDITRARDEMDWIPKVPFKEGMARTWEWMKTGSF